MFLLIRRLLIVFILPWSIAQAKSLEVLYAIPGDSVYYQNTTIPMKAVAKQLGIKLTVKSLGHRLAANYEHKLLKLLNTIDNPDWLIWVQHRYSTQKILDTLEQRGIKSIDITAGSFPDNLRQIGYPQQKYKHWMAQVVTNEFDGGQRLASGLISAAKGNAEVVNFVALSGTKSLSTVVKKLAGMKQVIATTPKVNLLQVLHINWNREDANVMTKQLLRRYKNVNTLSAGNTDIAIGAIEAIDQLNQASSQTKFNTVIANIGWSDEIFTAIKADKIAFSLGANHLNGLWAMVLIHDFNQGLNLLTTPASTVIKVPYAQVSKDNIDQIEPFFSEKHWQGVDVRQYSKVYNKQLIDYHFDFSLLLN